MPDLVTLGFAFDAGNAQSQITTLIQSFEKLKTNAENAKTAVHGIFNTGFKTTLKAARRDLGKFNAGLTQTADFAKRTVTAIKPLPAQIGKISAEKVRPIPSEVLKSLAEYSRRLQEAADAVERLNFVNRQVTPAHVNALGGAMRQTGRSAGDLATSLGQIVRGGAMAAFFRDSTEMAIKFGVELAHVKSLTVDFNVDRIRKGLLDLGSEYGSATKNANALYYAYSSGVRGSEAELVAFTGKMAQLATLIRADVTQTMDAATAAMNAYNLSAKDAGELTDLFYAIVKQGKARGDELASGLGQVISTAKTAGLNLDEMGAAIASLTKVMKTRQAITFFNNMLSKMIKPTKESRLAAEKLGVELGLNAIRAKGFSNVLQEIRDKTKGSEQALLSLFPDLRGQRAGLQLLGAGWGDFQKQLVYFANKAGVADDAMKLLTNDINYQLSVLPNTFNNIKIAVGDLLTNLLTFGGALSPVVAAFNKMGESGQTLVASLVLLAGGYVAIGTVKKVYHGLQLIEMRYNEALSAQRTKESAQRNRIFSATTRDIVVKRKELMTEAQQLKAGAATNAMIAKKIQLQAAEHAGLAAKWSALAQSLQLELQEARARGNNILAEKLELQYRNALIMAAAAENKASAATVAAKHAEANARIMNAQAATLEGKATAMGRVGAVRRAAAGAWGSMVAGATAAKGGMGGGMALIPGATALAALIGALSPLMVKLSLAATGMTTALISTGTGLAITGVSAVALTKALMTTTISLAHPIASFNALAAAGATAGAGVGATAVAVGGLAVGAAAVGYTIGSILYRIPAVQKAFDALAEAIYDFATAGFLSEQRRRNQMADLMRQNFDRINAAIGTADAARQEVFKALEQAVSGQVTDAEKVDKLNSRQAKAVENARKNTLEAIRGRERELEAMKKAVLDQNAINGGAAEHKRQIDRLSKELEKAKLAYTGANNALVGIFNESANMIKELQGKSKEMGKKYDTIDDTVLDYLFKSDSTDKFRLERMKFRSNWLWEQSGVKMTGEGIDPFNQPAYSFKLPEGSVADVEGSYKKAVKAKELFLQVQKEELNAKKKIADAERRANENTLRLVQSMDKFNATTTTAVRAYSLESQKLQSRQFAPMASVKGSFEASRDVMNTEAEVRKTYRELAGIAAAFRLLILDEKEKTDKQITDLSAKLKETGKEIVAALGGKEQAEAVKHIEKMMKSLGLQGY